MRTLVIDTSTEACSVALFKGDRLVGAGHGSDGLTLLDYRHEVLGRGHAERLIPMIADLPGNGRAQAIRVGLGPGSFTGLRIGLAAARALAIAWDSEVLGFPSLALTAATGIKGDGKPVTVCMNGGHGEWFIQNFNAALLPEDTAHSLAPEQAKLAARHTTLIGNRARQFGELLGNSVTVIEQCPDARFFPHVNPDVLEQDLSLTYGRAPDAKPSK